MLGQSIQDIQKNLLRHVLRPIKIGTQGSIRVLTRLGKSRAGSLIPRMKEALKKIEERTKPSKT